MNRLLPLTTLTALALVITGCANTPTTEPDAATPRIEHVHGIAEDPRGTDLLVATHNGIYAVTPDGEVSGPIGGHDFDAMGFTIAEDTLFASGHPGPKTAAELGAPNLGIIQSDDYGQTWSPVALNGSTDFHVLTAGPTAPSTESRPATSSSSSAPTAATNGQQEHRSERQISSPRTTASTPQPKKDSCAATTTV